MMTESGITDRADLISKLFKEKYICEEITANKENLELIKVFSGGEKGKGVEKFLKDRAWNENQAGKTRVYLIKERSSGELRAYFSIKCGLLYAPTLSERIEGDDRDFFELILEALRNGEEELLADYAASGMYTTEEFKKFYDEAYRILEADKEAAEGVHNSYDVAMTYPAVEIENLCRNFAVPSQGKIPFGFLVFWVCIIPKVAEISRIAGCEYIYIFAADQKDDEKAESQSLISYYRTNFGFHDAEGLHFIRPRYDYSCYEMVQTVQEAIENSKNIWNQIEDITETLDMSSWL